MRILWEGWALVLGLIIGSFLNVIIARLPEGQSIVRPRSRCPRCATPIRAVDNIPVVSWILLRGRCRSCALPISARYPIVELLVGLLFFAIARHWGLEPRSLGYAVFVSLLVAVTYIDLDHWIIPHALTWPGIVLGLGVSFANPDLTPFDAVVGAAAGFAVFALVAFVGSRVFRKEALGQGDWWLLAMIGAFLGWKALLPVILLASLQGTVVGLLLIVLGRAETGRHPGETAPPVPPVPSGAAATAGVSATSPDPSAAAPAPEPIPAEGRPAAAPDATTPASAAAPPTAAPAGDDEDEDWVPPANAVPFGPFLALAALEQLFVGEWLASLYEGLVRRFLL